MVDPWRALAFAAGFILVARTILAVVRVFVLPRGSNEISARAVFVLIRALFLLRLKGSNSFTTRDAAMALYAPISLLALLFSWLVLVILGYAGMYWGLGVEEWEEAVTISGSSLLTLGIVPPHTLPTTLLSFSEAALGMTLVALLIAYLPSIYSAFSQREEAVTMLEVRAGSPPTPAEFLRRVQNIDGWRELDLFWRDWERWFVDIEENHTTFTSLAFFRSPQPHRSWITAAGAVLDTASLMIACLDRPASPVAALCLRSGFLALRQIARQFQITFPDDPKPGDPISVSRAEFDVVWNRFAEIGLPLIADQDAAWRAFAGWRVNYDRVLLALADLTMAPESPWCSDRSLRKQTRLSWRWLQRGREDERLDETGLPVAEPEGQRVA